MKQKYTFLEIFQKCKFFIWLFKQESTFTKTVSFSSVGLELAKRFVDSFQNSLSF